MNKYFICWQDCADNKLASSIVMLKNNPLDCVLDLQKARREIALEYYGDYRDIVITNVIDISDSPDVYIYN